MPPNETLFREPVDHAHADVMIEDENASTALVDGGDNDQVLNEFVHLNFVQGRNLRMDRVVEFVFGLGEQISEYFLCGSV